MIIRLESNFGKKDINGSREMHELGSLNENKAIMV